VQRLRRSVHAEEVARKLKQLVQHQPLRLRKKNLKLKRSKKHQLWKMQPRKPQQKNQQLRKSKTKKNQEMTHRAMKMQVQNLRTRKSKMFNSTDIRDNVFCIVPFFWPSKEVVEKWIKIEVGMTQIS
jgi:hypothetical protein